MLRGIYLSLTIKYARIKALKTVIEAIEKYEAK